MKLPLGGAHPLPPSTVDLSLKGVRCLGSNEASVGGGGGGGGGCSPLPPPTVDLSLKGVWGAMKLLLGGAYPLPPPTVDLSMKGVWGAMKLPFGGCSSPSSTHGGSIPEGCLGSNQASVWSLQNEYFMGRNSEHRANQAEGAKL